MDVLLSLPLTAPRHAVWPASFHAVCDESDLSDRFERRFVRLGRGADWLAQAYLAWTLLRKRSRFDVVVTGRYGEYFAVLQSLLPFGKRPHLLLDVEWLAVEGRPWRRALNRWLHRRMVAGASRVQVFCRAEASNYARHFGVSESKFVSIPYSSDAQPIPLASPPCSGGYVFACGDHQRDYPTLLAAVAGLPVEVRIAARESSLGSLELPENVKLLGRVREDEYWRVVAGCRFLVVPVRPGLLRYSGVKTYAEAMHAGKCIVVNDPFGASSYIEHGKTGFLVQPEDPAALRRQICELLASPETVEAVGASARKAALERLSGAAYVRTLTGIVSEVRPDG